MLPWIEDSDPVLGSRTAICSPPEEEVPVVLDALLSLMFCAVTTTSWLAGVAR